MNRFEARNVSEAVVPADRRDIWKVLTDPDTLAALTPLVDQIDVRGEHWHWTAGISALGICIAPSFTERMTFTELEQIVFAHEPPAGATERAGAHGVYRLSEAASGTYLSVDITLHVELPLPRMARPAVERVMDASMRRTGDAFARNLLDHLGVRAAAG